MMFLRQYRLVLLLFFVINAGFFTAHLVKIPLFNNWSIPGLSVLFLVSSLIALVIFFLGSRETPQDQTFYTFISVSVKFLAGLPIALIWFVVLKKTSPAYILLFFLLYLAFSTATMVTILKALKTKNL